MDNNKTRCPWCLSHPDMIQYHDDEWGVPVTDDIRWFEFIVLDTFQAGLSWKTILLKRAGFSKAFYKFNYKKVANMTQTQIDELCNFDGIIKNRSKIKATVNNAIAFQKIVTEFGSFNNYIWNRFGNTIKVNKFRNMTDIPAKTPEAEALSKDLYTRGFTFTGPVICYAFMQAAGLVNDHLVNCFRYKEIKDNFPQGKIKY